MPLSSYATEDPFDNHPLFKSEEQARLEETMDGTEPAVDVTGDSRRGRARRRSRARRSLPPTTASGAARATSTGATDPGPRR